MFFSLSLASTPVAPAATPTKEAPIVARMTHTFPEDHVFSLSAKNWANLVEKETGGRLVVKIFPNAQLYKEAQEISAVRSGAVELLGTRVAVMPTVDPTMEVLQLPFMWKDYGQLSKFVNEPIMQNWYESKWNKELGLKFLAHNYLGGGVYFFNKIRAINKVEDLKGIKMRIWPAKSITMTAKVLGINGVVIGINETFTALQQGMVDGVITSTQAYLTRSFVDVAKFATSKPNLFAQAGWLIANGQWWSKLPSDIQKILWEKVRFAAEAYTTKISDEADEPTFEKLRKEKGAVITKFSDEESNKITQTCRPVFDEVGKVIDPQILDAAYKATGVK